MDNSKRSFKASVIQICASADLEADIQRCTHLMGQAVSDGAKLLTLPEICVGFDQSQRHPKTVALTEQEHPALPAFSAFAIQHGVEILIGSIGIKENDNVFNRSYLIGANGAVLAHYDKMHLFDINLGNGSWFKESDSFGAGKQAVIAPCMGGLSGMSICYDLRFPQLYRTYAQAGAEVLFVPAAFTRPTGKAHWHSLLRARAIENGAWVIAPAQHGTADGGCYGHSLIIDPWGTIQAECTEGEAFAIAEIDLNLAEKTRAKIPSLRAQQAFTLKKI